MERYQSCLFFSRRRRHTTWPRDWSSDVCSSDLCVAPDLQGRGISTALLLGAAPFLPDGVSEVWVLTPRDDARAIDAYMENGFEHQFDETTDRITKAQLRKLLVPSE